MVLKFYNILIIYLKLLHLNDIYKLLIDIIIINI